MPTKDDIELYICGNSFLDYIALVEIHPGVCLKGVLVLFDEMWKDLHGIFHLHQRVGGHLKPKAAGATVQHDDNLPLLQTEELGTPGICDLIDDLYLKIVIPSAQRSELGSSPFLARAETAEESPCSMRPYSSQCSLSSGHAYPCRMAQSMPKFKVSSRIRPSPVGIRPLLPDVILEVLDR